jgi:hypothetical protein
MGQHILQPLDEQWTAKLACVNAAHACDPLRSTAACESATPSPVGIATRPARRWLIPILITVFAFLLMSEAERRADDLQRPLAAYSTAARR